MSSNVIYLISNLLGRRTEAEPQKAVKTDFLPGPFLKRPARNDRNVGHPYKQRALYCGMLALRPS